MSRHLTQARVARGALLDDLLVRIPQPVDPLEVAAVIESMGITDPAAAREYGSRDVFDLARRLFPRMLRLATAREETAPGATAATDKAGDHGTSSLVDTSFRGMLAVAPLVLLLVVMDVLRRAGWTTGWLLAMSFGASVAMLVTAGPILAAGRRTAIYLGLGHDDAARRFSAAAAALVAGICLVAAASGLGALTALEAFAPSERGVFAVSIVAFGLLWVLAAALSASGGAAWALGCSTGGVAVGIATGAVGGSFTGIGTGYACCVAGLGVGWARAYAPSALPRMQLPRPRLLLVEAAPFVLFGTLFSVFFLEPHVLGWLGGGGGSTLDRLRVFELSFLLALPPVLLAAGVQELAIGAFWHYSRQLRERRDAERFSSALSRFHARQTIRYAAILTATTAITVAVVEAVATAGGLHSLDQATFLPAVVAMGLVGLGQFHCFFLLGLGLTRAPITAAAAGVTTVTAFGAPMAQGDYRLAALGFAAGAVVFAGVAWVGCRQLIGDVDHHYATAF